MASSHIQPEKQAKKKSFGIGVWTKLEKTRVNNIRFFFLQQVRDQEPSAIYVHKLIHPKTVRFENIHLFKQSQKVFAESNLKPTTPGNWIYHRK